MKTFIFIFLRNPTIYLFNDIQEESQCGYERLCGIPKEEGNQLDIWRGFVSEDWLEKMCGEKCDRDIKGCYSFKFCPGRERSCFFYDKWIKGDEPTIEDEDCYTSYKSCSRGIFRSYSNHSNSMFLKFNIALKPVTLNVVKIISISGETQTTYSGSTVDWRQPCIGMNSTTKTHDLATATPEIRSVSQLL